MTPQAFGKLYVCTQFTYNIVTTTIAKTQCSASVRLKVKWEKIRGKFSSQHFEAITFDENKCFSYREKGKKNDAIRCQYSQFRMKCRRQHY